MKVNENNIIMYRFYEKPTNPNTVLHFRTAMAEDSKMRSLTNEVIRRMLTTGEMIPARDRCEILDSFAQKIKNSGYGLNQIRRVILAGIKGYENLIRRCKKGERSLHRSSAESSSLRARKKLTDKSEWFKKSDKPNADPEEEDNPTEKWLKAGNGGDTRATKQALKHWQDFEVRSTDSHILKHWKVHHQGEGQPEFHIRVIKYCKDALSRQVGEAVRISYRGQTLNSKNGYNWSGLSRLVIEEKEEETLELPQIDEQPDPKGLPALTGGWKTGKRDAETSLLVRTAERRESLSML